MKGARKVMKTFLKMTTFRWVVIALCCVVFTRADIACAEDKGVADKSGASRGNPVRGIFSKEQTLKNVFSKPIQVAEPVDSFIEPDTKGEKTGAPAKPANGPSSTTPVPSARVDMTDDFPSEALNMTEAPNGEILPPEQTPFSVLNTEAPSAFRAMVTANRGGDRVTAEQYADQFVRYKQNLMFEVREYTHLIGMAMIRRGILDEKSWVGVEQYLGYRFAKAQAESGSAFAVKEEASLDRIQPDQNGRADIYYFFSVGNGFCQDMAPDVERIWRMVQADPTLRMVALTMKPERKDWVDSYRKFTGLTVPIFEGADVARRLNVAFVPTVVIVEPTSRRAYMRTGQLTFESFYRFVRKVQGKPLELSPAAVRLLEKPIGNIERAGLVNGKESNARREKLLAVGVTPGRVEEGVRF